MDLNGLPRGDVGGVMAGMVGYDIGNIVGLLRIQFAARNLDADHVDAILALAIDALLQTHGLEAIGVERAVMEGLDGFFVTIKFVVDD